MSPLKIDTQTEFENIKKTDLTNNLLSYQDGHFREVRVSFLNHLWRVIFSFFSRKNPYEDCKSIHVAKAVHDFALAHGFDLVHIGTLQGVLKELHKIVKQPSNQVQIQNYADDLENILNGPLMAIAHIDLLRSRLPKYLNKHSPSLLSAPEISFWLDDKGNLKSIGRPPVSSPSSVEEIKISIENTWTKGENPPFTVVSFYPDTRSSFVKIMEKLMIDKLNDLAIEAFDKANDGNIIGTVQIPGWLTVLTDPKTSFKGLDPLDQKVKKI